MANTLFQGEFEKPILELERQIAHLRRLAEDRKLDVQEEIVPLEDKLVALRRDIYDRLTPIQKVQVARHPERPYTNDYIRMLFTDFIELKGDRLFRDDPAIVGGWARFHGRPVVVIGHQKGRDAKENLLRTFGCAHPEGYRKALRLMHMAERFNAPVITLVDTMGAYPGIGGEERRGDGRASHAHCYSHHWGRWIGRRTGVGTRRQSLDFGTRSLLRHLTGRLCRDPLEGRCTSGASG